MEEIAAVMPEEKKMKEKKAPKKFTSHHHHSVLYPYYLHNKKRLLLKEQLKVGLLLATLISVYYHGFDAIVSCSFLNPGSIVHARASTSEEKPNNNVVVSKDGVIIMSSHHHSHHPHHNYDHNNDVDRDYDDDRNQDWEDNDLIQAGQQQKHQPSHQKFEHDDDDDDEFHQKESSSLSSTSQLQQQQANDILTMLMYSQGRIDEEADLYDGGGGDGRKSAEHVNLLTVDDVDNNYGYDGGRNGAQSKAHKEKMQIEKRYALFTSTNISNTNNSSSNRKGRLGFKRVKGGNNLSVAEGINDILQDKSANFDQKRIHVHDDKKKTSAKGKVMPDMGITCKDESGKIVSWFIAYKLPQIPASADPLLKQGSKYYYILSGEGNSWTESKVPIHDGNSLLGKTLEILWKNDSKSTGKDDAARIFYNDQPPSKPAIVMNGHTKGLILTSSKGGLWLQHSCPHFPEPNASNFTESYPIGGHINGQMFFCMSLPNTSTIDEVGGILQYTNPFLYNYSIPTSIAPLIPQLTKVAEQNATVKSEPWMNTYEMETLSSSSLVNGPPLHIRAYAKGPKFRKDVYSAWIAPEYGASLDVQSWLNGPHPLLSNCTSDIYPVYNVVKKSLGGLNFSYIDDHSKWAVSTNKDKPVTCVGDLNRMKPQKTRGGVTICVTNEQIWEAFNALVKQIQPCNSTSLRDFSTLLMIHPQHHQPHSSKKSGKGK